MQRKPRNKMAKKKLDLTIPLDLQKIGTKDDPCFGKYYSIKADECSACGDSEICQIICAQKAHTEVEGQEATHRFKDLEEVNIIRLKKDTQFCKDYLSKRAKRLDKTSFGYELVCSKLTMEHGIKDPKTILDNLIKEGFIKFIKNKTKIKLI